jgi:hypothetical protein
MGTLNEPKHVAKGGWVVFGEVNYLGKYHFPHE